MVPLTSYPHSYQREGWTIQFNKGEDQSLTVTMESDTLTVRSIQTDDLQHYVPLYGDPKVMQLLLTGETRDETWVANRVNNMVEKWKAGNPFSHMPVFKKEGNTFLGSVFLHDDSPGVAELSGLGDKDYWRHGYGTQIASLIVNHYSVCLQEEGYLVKGERLQKIFATARPDNPGSIGILKNLGMTYVRTEEKYGAPRHVYEILVDSSSESSRN